MLSEADMERFKEYGLQLARHVFERDGDALVLAVSKIIADEQLTIGEETRARLLDAIDSVKH